MESSSRPRRSNFMDKKAVTFVKLKESDKEKKQVREKKTV